MSTEFLIMAVIAVISYFIGSISTAILVGKILGGDDIRSHGSGVGLSALTAVCHDTRSPFNAVIRFVTKKFSWYGITFSSDDI